MAINDYEDPAKKTQKTKHIEIIDYWCGRVYEGDMGVDWSDTIMVGDKCSNDLLEEQELTWEDLEKLEIPSNAKYRCWRCADLRRQGKIEKCHIIAHQFEGKDEPSNYVLLCKYCHEQSPDVVDKNAIWEWIKATSYGFYGQFWAEQKNEEFERIYGRRPFSGDSSSLKECKELKTTEEKISFFDEWWEDFGENLVSQAGLHGFALSHRGLAPATYAMLMKKMGA